MRKAAMFAGLFLFLMICICHGDVPPVHAARQISATVISSDAGSLSVQVIAAPNAKPTQQIFPLDPQTIIVRNDIDVGGIKTVPATTADLKAGAHIVLTLKDRKLMEVRLLAPPPVSGKVIAVDAQSITVHPAHGPDQKLSVDPQRTKVMQMRVQFGPLRTVSTKEIREGQSVNVLAKEGFAFVARIQPAPPVIGRIIRLDDTLVSIQPTTRPSQPVAAMRNFPMDRRKTELYHEYVGEPLEPARWEDFNADQVAAVTIEDGMVTAITLPHPAVYGRIARIGASWIDVTLAVPVGAPAKRFNIDSHTKILLGKPMGSATRPSGGVTRFWNYLPGAALGDLKMGERVSVTAKGELVLSMRVTPSAPVIAAAK